MKAWTSILYLRYPAVLSLQESWQERLFNIAHFPLAELGYCGSLLAWGPLQKAPKY